MAHVWLITGGSSGFGRQVAIAAAKMADTVVASLATSWDPSKLEDLKSIGNIFPQRLDICASDADVQDHVAENFTAVGRIDVVVNNVGYILEGAIEECNGQEGSHFRTSFPGPYATNCSIARDDVLTIIFMALIVGSAFYRTPDPTAGFASKGGLLFFAGLLNTFTAMSAINNLYSQSPTVVKQASYTFYHPSTEAIAGVIGDILVKFVVAVVFNTIMYFMGYLRREASQFFIYILITFVIMLVMSAVFRTVAAVTKTISQAIGLAEGLIVALIVGCGSGIGGWVEAV
ncbi:hypothetical protein CNMCM6936_006502 [Aspergillus lentulus]|nr:hypothetical protein CNMCM6069_000398 [Aspergillus lentulus]KAF4166416.1 hypothetical protein CNMCM6936_006502 [Aspergillus lentulus]KAF4170471.1 hypothetical protein CNMCM8060_005312 [Aspergillus lentulus]KAF4197766.1 hypothetical protein CNMCM8694_001854 [Aspergillus lentulus]